MQDVLIYQILKLKESVTKFCMSSWKTLKKCAISMTDARFYLPLTIGGEVLVGAATSDEPAAPLDGVLVVDGLLRVEEVVEQRVEVLRRLGRLRALGRVALGLHVRRRAALPLPDEDLGVGHGGGGGLLGSSGVTDQTSRVTDHQTETLQQRCTHMLRLTSGGFEGGSQSKREISAFSNVARRARPPASVGRPSFRRRWWPQFIAGFVDMKKIACEICELV